MNDQQLHDETLKGIRKAEQINLELIDKHEIQQMSPSELVEALTKELQKRGDYYINFSRHTGEQSTNTYRDK